MTVQPVEFVTADGVTLRGQRWGSGDHWAILVHDFGTDLDCWLPLVTPLTSRDFTVLAVDLRGHGTSDGDAPAANAELDIAAALGYCEAASAASISLVAAGETAISPLVDHLAQRIQALVLLSPGPELTYPVEALRGRGVPKLFILGSVGQAYVDTVQRIRAKAIAGHWLCGCRPMLRAPRCSWGNGVSMCRSTLLVFSLSSVITTRTWGAFMPQVAGGNDLMQRLMRGE